MLVSGITEIPRREITTNELFEEIMHAKIAPNTWTDLECFTTDSHRVSHNGKLTRVTVNNIPVYQGNSLHIAVKKYNQPLGTVKE